MKRVMAKEEARGNKYFSHFGPEANHFDKIQKTLKAYGEKGSCLHRYYLHNEEKRRSHLGKSWVNLRRVKTAICYFTKAFTVALNTVILTFRNMLTC